MLIREFKTKDVAQLAQIMHQAVHHIANKDYSKQQLDAWSPAPVPIENFLTRIGDNRIVLVAVNDRDQPLAFIELELNGHIDCFYCSPEFARAGIGQALYQELERRALKLDLRTLSVEASETALPFFLKHSFTIIKRQDLVCYNIHIHNFKMEKKI